VLCHHELFNPRGIHLSRRLGGRLDLGGAEARDRDPVALLERAWRAHLGHQAVGFKLNLGQEPRGVENNVSHPAHTFAERTGEWESYPELALRGDPPRVPVPAGELRAHAERNAAYYAALERRLVAAGKPWIEVAYERLGETVERERVLAFLGVSRSPLTGATRRQHPQPLRELIANFAELQTELRGSELEAELCAEG
jgi:hypothetical protein